MVVEQQLSGRYGSGAMGEMESQASENLANALTNRAAELAYSNFGAERARQDAAIASAPQNGYGRLFRYTTAL